MPVELPAPLVQVEWCAPYTGVVRSAVHALKYRGERRLARPLGAALARRWARAGAGGEVLVPVPVHATRLADRGYDQAVLLAAAAGEGLGLPVRPVLVRRRATARQFDLDRDRRAANVGGAFACATGAGPIVTGRWVILVDDVLTTGATAAACATTLLAGGALAVSLVAVARER
jgi:ComF family protein